MDADRCIKLLCSLRFQASIAFLLLPRPLLFWMQPEREHIDRLCEEVALVENFSASVAAFDITMIQRCG